MRHRKRERERKRGKDLRGGAKGWSKKRNDGRVKERERGESQRKKDEESESMGALI